MFYKWTVYSFAGREIKMNILKCIDELKSERVKGLFAKLYGDDENAIQYQLNRYSNAIETFKQIFPGRSDIKIYSASGRTEIGGNHTDHQRGVVLAGAVNLDIVAVVSFHNDGVIRVKSEGYEMAEVKLCELTPTETDNGTRALIRGIAAKFAESGVDIKGFDAYTVSDVISGGGISSSAAFETLIGTIINNYYNDNKSTPFEIAQIGWFAENKFFGKKCGLLDQTVSSYGGLITADFNDVTNPEIEQIAFDFEKFGYALCITDTKSSHADLTDDYDSITDEMKQVSHHFGCEVLSQVDEAQFYAKIAELRKTCCDRALLRAMHFFNETKRAGYEAAALKNNDIDLFLKLVNESGESSAMLLQNLYSTKTPTQQAIPLGIALSKAVLNGRGAVRVHGGGFAGTIQAYVPVEIVNDYKTAMESVYGNDTCHLVRIRPFGGIEII